MLTDDGSGVCCDCGAAFEFNPAFYAGRGLANPRRCTRCRVERRATLQHGTVTSAGRMFLFLRADSGEEFFVPDPARYPGLAAGTRVVFQTRNGGLPPSAGRRRTAAGVRPEGSLPAPRTA